MATLDAARLDLGVPGEALPCSVIPAPLRGQTYLLTLATPAVESRLREAGEGVLVAEPANRAWSVQSRGRVLFGRRINTDIRRAELSHWLPANAVAADYIALRFFPETLDYQYDAADGRRRASGPIPGAARPPAWRAAMLLGGDRFWPWFAVSGVLQAIALLVWGSPESRNAFVLALVLACGMLPIIATKISFAALDMERWRRGLETEAAVKALLEAALPERWTTTFGSQLLLVSAGLWVLLMLTAGSVVSAICGVVSGAPAIILLLAVRRRSTASAKENA